ncbi:MAG: LysR family transcriptional regulator [Granulosicoccus sp.]
MEIQQIRYFLALSEDLNFTRAAERCGVSQPSLTRAIKRLEDDLGAQLVRRERSRTHLTELGMKIKPRLARALALTDKAHTDAAEFSQMKSPKLSIGVMNTVGPGPLMSIINHLNKKFPQLKLVLKTSSGNEVIEWLLAGEVDVAVVGMRHYPDLIAVHELYEERYMVAIPPDHHFFRKNAIPFKEFAREKVVKRLNCEYMDFLNSELADREPETIKEFEDSIDSIDVVHEIENEKLTQTMISAGMGCAIVPEYLANTSNLHMRPLIEPEISRTVGIATVRGRPHTPVVSYFTNLCQNMKSELEL